MIALVNRMLAPLHRRVMLMVGRVVIKSVNDGLRMQRLQVVALDGETKDDVERYQNYGFTGVPFEDAEGVMVSVGGSRDHGIVIAVDDRRFRLVGLAPGEVAMYTDEGDSIVMRRGRNINVTAGTKINAIAPNIEIAATVKVLLTTPLVEASQDMKINGKLNVVGSITGAALLSLGDVTAYSSSLTPLSMSNMKVIFNGHTHVENALPGSTATPSQQL